MTAAPGDANTEGQGENTVVLAPESVSPRRRRRQVRDELLEQSDAEELLELLELVEDRLRGTTVTWGACSDDVPLPRREAA